MYVNQVFYYDIFAFDGGFVGVDVFFTISGYLITSIIYYQVTNNKFTSGILHTQDPALTARALGRHWFCVTSSSFSF
ncbi:MAG: hypothetical protein ACI936_002575 [Paraglaciecola sp.]